MQDSLLLAYQCVVRKSEPRFGGPWGAGDWKEAPGICAGMGGGVCGVGIDTFCWLRCELHGFITCLSKHPT